MAKPQFITKLERDILLRATNEAQGALLCPEDYSSRIWMIHLAKLQYKGFIDRRGRYTYISDIGRAALTVSFSSKGSYGILTTGVRGQTA